MLVVYKACYELILEYSFKKEPRVGWEWEKASPDRTLISERKEVEYKGNHSFREEKIEERAALIQKRWALSLGVL